MSLPWLGGVRRTKSCERKITSESDVVSIFVVGDGGGIMEDTDLLRLNEATCSLLSEWLPGGRGLATKEMRGHWLRRHPRSKQQSSRWWEEMSA